VATPAGALDRCALQVLAAFLFASCAAWAVSVVFSFVFEETHLPWALLAVTLRAFGNRARTAAAYVCECFPPEAAASCLQNFEAFVAGSLAPDATAGIAQATAVQAIVISFFTFPLPP
jgi:hypothetical protein